MTPDSRSVPPSTSPPAALSTAPQVELPAGWDAAAHEHWRAGHEGPAIQGVLAALNRHGAQKPARLVLQFVYYLFLRGDYAGAAGFLQRHLAELPASTAPDQQVLLNLAVCLSRSGQLEAAVDQARKYLAQWPDDVLMHDTLASGLSQLGRTDEARLAGTQALTLKDAAASGPSDDWTLPAGGPRAYLRNAGKPYVMAFSLWGAQPRYLRGALHNALLAPQLFRGWMPRFYVDDTVPAELLSALAELGAEIRTLPNGQSLRQKLCWRFDVANDPAVGRFMVRDVDSVITPRERLAVDEWMASSAWFHVMRDWWTHTDLVLAGMWGGVAGVLPSLDEKLAHYTPTAAETPNIDQWFLRDKVWAYMRQSCLTHDRYFSLPGSRPWPGPVPEGTRHVGQNEYAARQAEQADLLAPWISRLSCLHETRR